MLSDETRIILGRTLILLFGVFVVAGMIYGSRVRAKADRERKERHEAEEKAFNAMYNTLTTEEKILYQLEEQNRMTKQLNTPSPYSALGAWMANRDIGRK